MDCGPLGAFRRSELSGPPSRLRPIHSHPFRVGRNRRAGTGQLTVCREQRGGGEGGVIYI
jgi:hypothetical protein